MVRHVTQLASQNKHVADKLIPSRHFQGMHVRALKRLKKRINSAKEFSVNFTMRMEGFLILVILTSLCIRWRLEFR